MPHNPEEDMGLPDALSEIALQTPGVRLEHLDMQSMEDIGERAPWDSERKILPVERWLAIVWKDYKNAPAAARRTIVGPFYRWHRDEWGRAIIAANHMGTFINMFEEVWTGDPLSELK